jgi:putative transposase
VLARQRHDRALLKVAPYEEVYLHAYESAREAKAGIGRYITFYNSERPHSTLDGNTPDAVYFKSPPTTTAA